MMTDDSGVFDAGVPSALSMPSAPDTIPCPPPSCAERTGRRTPSGTRALASLDKLAREIGIELYDEAIEP